MKEAVATSIREAEELPEGNAFVNDWLRKVLLVPRVEETSAMQYCPLGS